VKSTTQILAAPKNNLQATSAPTVSDDASVGYAYGSSWVDTAAEKIYFCTSPAAGAGVWVEASGSGGGGGVTAVPLGAKTQVPAGVPGLFLEYGGVASSAAPYVATRAYTIVGASLFVNSPDPLQDFTLRLRVNGVVAESLALPATNSKAWASTFSTIVSPGDEIDVLLERTSGADKSTFSRVTATLELREN
jgi:hypothetical protein